MTTTKEQILINLGYGEVNECSSGTISFMNEHGYGFEIDACDVTEGSTCDQVEAMASLSSPCCGAHMDSDYMICSDCGEHC